MRATVRRIDLTQDPAEFEVWPSLDWLAEQQDADDRFAGPKGRSGLWDAMAQAVQRVREVSLAGADDLADAEVLGFASNAPHLAYLARVASTCGGRDDNEALPGAEVISMVDSRARHDR